MKARVEHEVWISIYELMSEDKYAGDFKEDEWLKPRIKVAFRIGETINPRENHALPIIEEVDTPYSPEKRDIDALNFLSPQNSLGQLQRTHSTGSESKLLENLKVDTTPKLDFEN